MLYMPPRATVVLVGVATLNLALPAPPGRHDLRMSALKG